MRPLRSSMRHRALKIAVAVSWASSIQLSGCINSPFRSDFIAEAKQAAAKQPVDSISDSIRDSEAETELESSRILLAGGEPPAAERRVMQVSGEKPAESGFSIWKFWKRDKGTSTDSKQDAPKEGAAAVAKKNTTPAKPTSVPSTAKTPNTAVASEKQKDAARRDLDPENWFAASGTKPKSSSTAKPSLTDTAETSKEIAPSAAPVSAMAPATASASLSRPFPAAADSMPTTPTTESTADSTPVTKTDDVKDAVASTTKTSNDLPSWLSSEPIRKEKIAAQSEPVAETQLTETATSETSASSMAAALPEKPETPEQAESLAQRQQRLRVNALMSDAHSCIIRGELHAAYRSALLAERIATEHQLSFTADEDDPGKFSRQIATRIWGADAPQDPTSELKPSTSPATLPSAKLAFAPATEPASGESEKGESWANVVPSKASDAAIPGPLKEQGEPSLSNEKQVPVAPAFGDAIAVWTPAPSTESTLKKTSKSIDNGVLNGKPDEKNAFFADKGNILSQLPNDGWSAPPQPGELLPEIRPANSKSDGRLAAPNRAFHGTSSRPMPLGDEGWMHSNSTMKPVPLSEQATSERGIESTSNGVQFAIAHNLSSVQEPRRFDARSALQLSDSGSISESTGPMAATVLDRQRPLLLAPPVPGPSMLEATALSGDGLVTSVDALGVYGDDAAPATKQSGGRLIWVIVGLLGSGIALVLGLKYARRDPEAQDNEAASVTNLMVEQPHGETDEETCSTEGNMSLKIKRAA